MHLAWRICPMALDKVVAPLLRVPLFAGLKPLQLTEIARNAERVKFRSGDVITQEGTLGDGAYLIVSGEAERRPRPGSFELDEPVEPGSLLGELAMLVEHVYGATVVACARVHCLKLTRAALHEQMRDDSALIGHFERLIEGRLAHVAAELQRIFAELNGRELQPAAPGPSPGPDLPAMPPVPSSPPFAATGTDG
jgi:CRP-like cAMP-binding protein